jgi:hypothetical protein
MGKMNLSETEREELMSLQRSRAMAVGQVTRARLILLLDEGASRAAIMTELRCDSRFITTWQTRFIRERLAGLTGLEARVLDYTLRRKPADDSTHWSSRKLAAQLGMAFMTVPRIWRKHENTLLRYSEGGRPYNSQINREPYASGCTLV